MKIRTSPFSRLATWIRGHKRLTYIITGVVIISACSAGVFLFLNQKPAEVAETTVEKPAPEPKPVIHYSPLTGEQVASEADLTAPVTAIMIENSPDARPQSGIKDAGVVYEAIAEGGITRFLTIFQNKKPGLIGPVRSLRMYYVDWLAPYNASVAHVGGSAAALAEVRNGNYRDIDQFFNAGSYWRASDRYAPHNVYTNFEKLDALNAAKGYTSSQFTGFARIDGVPAEQPTASNIQINFSSASYNTAYTYDKANNRYARFLGGEPHNDREAGQLTPSVVIALRVTMTHVMEDGYREQINTSGTGSAVLFQNGLAEEVTWHKADRASPLKITNANGEEVPLTRGQTWIAAVPTSGGGSIAWQP